METYDEIPPDELDETKVPLDGSFLDASVETVNSETFECDICGRGYKTKLFLKRHLKKHSSDEPFECKRCTQYFSNQKSLDDHVKSRHTEKIQLCVTCGKSFMTKSNLNSHTKLIHPEVGDAKPSHLMECPFEDCKKTFLQKEKYQDHMNTHTGIKPYSCAQCKREFHNRYIKARHEKSCKLGLSVNTCDVCNKDLCDKSSLKRHKDAQHSEKRFACLCGKNFAYHSSLLKHRKEKKH